MRKLFLSTILFFILQGLTAGVWYITGAGNDLNDGKTQQTAFRTLQHVVDKVQPGDVVWIGNGLYTNDEKKDDSSVLHISVSGTPEAWITWKAIKGHRPEICPTGWSGILVSGSYHILDGLYVIGRNDALTLKAALEDAKNETPDATFNSNGIYVNGRICKPDQKPHHVIIRNCVVAKCPGGGVNAIETDYVTVEDCLVYDNAWYMRYAGSGISTLHNWAHDDEPGYHFIIQRNRVWNNKCMVPWGQIGRLSDGNGIILDVTNGGEDTEGAANPDADSAVQPQSSQQSKVNKPKPPQWKGRSLVANNISAYNGGSGIHTFRTSHVDIINNTTYWNGCIVGYEEVFANRSNDIVFLNNVIVPRPGAKVTSNNKNKNIRWDYNLSPTGQDVYPADHDIVADPMFVEDISQILSGGFRVRKNSPALKSGTNDLLQAGDVMGKKRSEKSVDRGAYQK